MHKIQPQNEMTDMLVTREYTPLNPYEQFLIQQSRTQDNPRLFLVNQGLCIYHPEVARALSMTNQELLRLLSIDSQIPLSITPRSSFEIIG